MVCDRLNVNLFGAKGDGTSDDSATIRYAFGVLSAGGGEI